MINQFFSFNFISQFDLFHLFVLSWLLYINLDLDRYRLIVNLLIISLLASPKSHLVYILKRDFLLSNLNSFFVLFFFSFFLFRMDPGTAQNQPKGEHNIVSTQPDIKDVGDVANFVSTFYLQPTLFVIKNSCFLVFLHHRFKHY